MRKTLKDCSWFMTPNNLLDILKILYCGFQAFKKSIGIRSLIALLLLFWTILGFSQDIKLDIEATSVQRFRSTDGLRIEPGEKLSLISFDRCETEMCLTAVHNSQTIKIPYRSLSNLKYDSPNSLKQLWDIVKINSDIHSKLVLSGYNYELRRQLEEETIELLTYFERYYGFFEDEFLVDYLQRLLYKIHPITLDDGRPGSLSIKVLNSQLPNAFSAPNGTVIVTTGLLSTIRSEEELVGVLTHEVAHFVLDHHVVNILIERQRQKRAEFWAGFATAVAAASEVYLAAKHDIYTGGMITYSTAVLSTSIAQSIAERIGNNYSQKQEEEADNAARSVLTFFNKDPNAFSVALMRLRDYYYLNGYHYSLSASATHPALHFRIREVSSADALRYESKEYDRIISFVNTYNAIIEFGLSRFMAASHLISRNIEADVAVETDYILMSMTLRALQDTPESNLQALQMISTAKSLNVVPNIYVYKQEGITLLRLSKNVEAIAAFSQYVEGLELLEETYEINEEIKWAKKMIYKSRLF